ncbi:MAG TPA: trigger factor [Gemmatimonadetes bacterium]|nr:trigger factor [Gemmatimonadota bacterium]|tara:strand:+ start:2755 stop:4017 length:1263 start_codon:yes stop_codon:yes gene_type:complete
MAIEGAELQISVEEGERWRRTMNVIVPSGVVNSERRRLTGELAARVKLPGFRKGHVPSSVVEKRFGQSLSREALDKLIGAAYREALSQQELNPISEGEVDNVQYEPDHDLTFSISFDVRPEIELSRLGGFRVERPAVNGLEDKLEQVLGRLREEKGTWHPLEEGKPEDGNLVEVEIQRMNDGEVGEAQPYQLVLGQGDAIPNIEEAIKSLEIDGSGDFVVRFPDDFPNEERRGQEEHLHIRLDSRQHLVLPELDAEFAKSLGEFEGVEDLNEKIQADLEKEAEEQAESVVRGKLLDAILDANPFTVPVSMVDRYVESVLGNPEGVPPEKLTEAKEQLSPQAEHAVKRILAIDRLSEIQELGATEEELDDRIEEIAEKSGDTPARIYASLQKGERLEALEREITERKVFDFLKEQSEITEA